MTKKTKVSQQDMDAFLEAVKGTKPIPNRKVKLRKKDHRVIPKRDDHEPNEHLFQSDEMYPNLQPDDFIEHKRNGISDKMLRKIRKAEYNIEAVLDLHKLTVDQARIEVNDFLHECINRNIRVALIVHGKGLPGSKPVLKNQVNCWLRQVDQVLAFCSAAPKHGGQGAVYVLLKRVTEEKYR